MQFSSWFKGVDTCADCHTFHIWSSCGAWPGHSPDLKPFDCYLQGNLKDKVCRRNCNTEEQEQLLPVNSDLFKR
jgi:hypothetical protein